MPVEVQNTAPARCILQGYFAVSLLDASGRQIGMTPAQQADLAANPVSAGPVQLRQGETARFLFEWGDTPVGGQACPSASQVALTAPDQSDRVTLPAVTADGVKIAPCGAGFSQVGPVTPG